MKKKTTNTTKPRKSKFEKRRINSELSKKDFERYLEEIERKDYPWVAKDLPEKATALEKAKFAICQEFLTFKFRNHLTTQQIAKKIHLNKDESQKLLFC